MYQVIAMAPDQSTAALLIGFLKVNGVTVRELQITDHASFAGGDRSYNVEVRRNEREHAA